MTSDNLCTTSYEIKTRYVLVCRCVSFDSESQKPLYPCALNNIYDRPAQPTRYSLPMETFEMGKRLLSLSLAKPT